MKINNEDNDEKNINENDIKKNNIENDIILLVRWEWWWR